MDNYYKEQEPLLSVEEIEKIVSRFGENSYNLGDAYEIIFGDKQELGYTYQLYLEDIQNFQLVNEGSMNINEALAFIKTME